MERSTGLANATDVDVEALRLLFEQEYEPMFRLAMAMLGSAAEAEEVVQDGFVVIARRWATLDNPGGYLRMTVVNGARRRQRTRSRRSAAEARRRLDPAPDDPTASDFLLDVVDRLPERQRAAVVLQYYAGWSPTEIAEVFECPAATVRSLVHRALETMRKEVEQ